MNFSDNHHRPLLDFITSFEEGTLPHEEWTHAAHLTMALWYLYSYPPTDAVLRICEGIKHYNTAVGIAYTPTSGYHETLTLFYIYVLTDFITMPSAYGLPIETLVEMMLKADIADRAYPLRFYSKERLFSPEARAVWTEPDIKSLA